MFNEAQTKYIEKAIERIHGKVEEFYEQVESGDKIIEKNIESIEDEKIRNVLLTINGFYKINMHDLNGEILYIAQILESMRLNDPRETIIEIEKHSSENSPYIKWVKKSLDDKAKDTTSD